MSTGNRTAPSGQIYVCGACGKRSKDRYGEQAVDRGWDVSCMMWAVLCFNPRGPEGKWQAVPEPSSEECEQCVNPLLKGLHTCESGRLPEKKKAKRKHSRSGQLRCEICSPMRCSKAG